MDYKVIVFSVLPYFLNKFVLQTLCRNSAGGSRKS